MARRLGLKWVIRPSLRDLGRDWSLWPAVRGIGWNRLESDGWCQYPCMSDDGPGEDVLFAERFATADGLAKLVSVEPVAPAEQVDETYPYVLVTGRMLEHWHTGVLSRRSRILEELEPEAFVCINGEDLTALGATVNDALRVSSRRGTITARARLDGSLPRGTVFMPFCYAEAAANILTNPALDPESKIPEYKYAAVRIARSRPDADAGRAAMGAAEPVGRA